MRLFNRPTLLSTVGYGPDLRRAKAILTLLGHHHFCPVFGSNGSIGTRFNQTLFEMGVDENMIIAGTYKTKKVPSPAFSIREDNKVPDGSLYILESAIDTVSILYHEVDDVVSMFNMQNKLLFRNSKSAMERAYNSKNSN